MSNDLIELVKARKSFYRDHYHNMSTLLIGVLLLIIICNLFILYLYIARPIPDFYATSMDGKLVLLTPLDTPNYSSKPLI
jgi:intracellular multiplication protein IcmL